MSKDICGCLTLMSLPLRFGMLTLNNLNKTPTVPARSPPGPNTKPDPLEELPQI